MKVKELPTDLDFGDVLAAAETNATTDWAMDFVAQLSSRYDEYGDEMFISEKQWETLTKIARVD